MKSAVKIERGIPLPPARGSGITDALRAMKIGESIFLAGKNSSYKGAYTARVSGKFTARTVDGGDRIWRTS